MQLDPRGAPADGAAVSLLGGIASFIAALAGWRRYAVALGAGAVSILAMPPFFLWPVLLVTLPVLVWLIDGDAGREATRPSRLSPARWRLIDVALIGWCFGYGYHVPGLYWLREAFLVTGGRMALLWPLGVLGLPAFLAIYHGLATGFAAALPAAGARRVVALAIGLGLSEWLRGHMLTGFPWNVLGMALTGPMPLMQSTAVFGIYGLTIVAVAMLAAPLVMLAAGNDRPPTRRLHSWARAAALVVVPLGLMWAWGAWRLSGAPPAMVDGVRLRLVQPSVPQREKWLPEKQPEFIRQQIALSLRDSGGNLDNLAGITHVIWPEAAMPFLPLQRPEVLAAIGDALPDGVHLLAGVLRLERGAPQGTPAYADDDGGYRVFNSLAVFAPDGRPIAVYDKTHLVPFGEYLPLQGWLEAIGLSSLTRQRGGFAIGRTPRPLLHVPGLPGAGPLICYEAVFPGTTSSSSARPHVLVNVTNDGWFGNSTGPRQHLHQARLRSVEEGLPLLRVANNGISAVYDAYGRELARLDMDVAGVIDTGLPGRIERPFYSRLGDLFFALFCAGSLVFLGFTSRDEYKP